MSKLPRIERNEGNGGIGASFLEMYEFHKKWMEHYGNKYWDAIHQNDDRIIEEFEKKNEKKNPKEKIIFTLGSNDL